MKVSQSQDKQESNQYQPQQNRVKQEIRILLQNKYIDNNVACSTYRSGETSDADGTQLNSDRSHYKLLLKPREFSINSTNEKSNLQNLIDPILNKKNIQHPIKLLLNSPSSIGFNNNNNNSTQLISPFSGINQSIQQGPAKLSERSITDNFDRSNLTKNNYQEYILTEADNSKQNGMQFNLRRGINSSVMNISRDVSEKNQKAIFNTRAVKTERNSIIDIENYILENNHFYNRKKQQNNSFKENPNYETYQNQLLAYSMQKATNHKINPDYFTLAQQVCKNQNLMKLKPTHNPSASTGQSPRRDNQNHVNDMMTTYKQTVKKLINDRKELNKSKAKIFSKTNTISFNKISQQNTPLGSQQVIMQDQQQDLNFQNLQSYQNIQSQNIQSLINLKNLTQSTNLQQQQPSQSLMQKQNSYNLNAIQISNNQSQNTIQNENNSNVNTPQKQQQNSNFARFALEQIQDENQQKTENDNFLISNFNRVSKASSQNFNSLQNTPRSRPFTNSQKRIQRQQQQLQREYFSSLFEDNYRNEAAQKYLRIMSVNQTEKIDHKSENFKKNKINQLKRQEISQIKKLSQQLIENGKVNAQEQELLESKLKIQKFFLQKDVSLIHKKQCFKKLITEFNPSNQKYSQQNSSQITKMLTIMKPFYFDEVNNPTTNQYSHKIKQQSSENKKNQSFKASKTISSFGNTEQNFISQLTTFYNSKQNDLYQIKQQNQPKGIKFRSNPNLLNQKNFNSLQPKE
ncbi:hypothetical protein TTHERM_000326868 (macronuclear) [Tetrahymena thermophila SB210]|uniref:Uncharacterized protein n=1 Tax=Tetrahymena thermophila (strain SB210) TaxID=312017 RepID=W7X180_TETTS|nr:hypothetical protein TTHERM_000326868 [Tetrahymena thermophila SB210]EWS71317.1 hypothetical protein TTHERM_000326868 [Tetrahymena thermophila SB210]|eukprot:XP_012656135.1 hypothetical protein TTHERM_000326868 [Tetrahymena thermophila SB210]